MSVFFSFGDAQLGFVVLRHPFAEGVHQRCRRISAGDFNVRGVLGQHDEIEVHHFLTGEAVEIGVNEGAGNFARAVGAEVHENQRIAVFHRRIGLAFSANNGRFHELIVFIARISGLQARNGGIGLELAFCQGHQIVSLLNAVPTVVAVHGVVAANDRGDAAFAQRGKFVFEFRQRLFSAARRSIAAVEEGVQIDFIRAAFGCQLNHRHDVVFVAVDAARRHQAHDMHGFACGNGFIDRAGQYRVGEEGAFFDFNVQAGEILIHDTARAEVDVAHFGVAHLTIRQTDFQA